MAEKRVIEMNAEWEGEEGRVEASFDDLGVTIACSTQGRTFLHWKDFERLQAEARRFGASEEAAGETRRGDGIQSARAA